MSSVDQLVHIEVSSPILHSARVQQVEALFDVPHAETSENSWDVHLPLSQQPWKIGLIVGPSGCGKTTIARELWPDAVRTGYDWDERALLDNFDHGVSIKDITAALGAVGFGSPPNWLRPYAVLSTGEQFRATVARALTQDDQLVVIDEFTSVVDRTVAQVASHTIQKAIRRSEKQLIAVTCHYDVLDWLQPDWVYQPHMAQFDWRALQRRPALTLEVMAVDHSAWRLFSQYHYLSASLHKGAQCFAAFLPSGECVAFTSYLHMPHPHTRNIKQNHRLVVRPDYQGLGIGGRLNEWLGDYLWDRGFRYHTTLAHPALIAYYSRSPRWRRINGSGVSQASTHIVNTRNLRSGPHANASLRARQAILRRINTKSFEYTPEAHV